MVVTIDFNNIKHSRNINLESEYDKEDGIYLFHSIVWNGEEDELKVFTEKTTLNIKIYITNNDSHNEVYSKIHTNIVKSASNTERKIDINLSDTENFQIFVRFISSYRCMGYTGFNCQFECDQENYDIECDYETGLAFCKNRSLFNPPFCNLGRYDSCPEDEKKKCRNNGKCVKLAENWYDCICQRGYGGKNCEFFYCVPPCNADYENCTGPNICSCLNKNKTIPFCNITTCAEDSCEHGGKCKIRYNAIICMCNTSKYAGQFCEKECPKPCLYGICSYFKTHMKYYLSNSETFFHVKSGLFHRYMTNLKIAKNELREYSLAI
ncbi:hypothetical protein HZS_1032 [Henneguya salminicola]|nr:hypothetical protein HZS_1032 [Henneguya salminicola]